MSYDLLTIASRRVIDELFITDLYNQSDYAFSGGVIWVAAVPCVMCEPSFPFRRLRLSSSLVVSRRLSSPSEVSRFSSSLVSRSPFVRLSLAFLNLRKSAFALVANSGNQCSIIGLSSSCSRECGALHKRPQRARNETSNAFSKHVARPPARCDGPNTRAKSSSCNFAHSCNP